MAKIKWINFGTEVTPEGRTVTYVGDGTDFTIESRRRHIPHANREGYWDHTTYFLLRAGEEVAEKWSLRDAKALAEEMM